MKRRDARRAVFALIFDKDFNPEISCKDILENVIECGFIKDYDGDEYISRVFFGVFDKIDELDEDINHAALGWNAERISRVSRAILRLALYEIRYEDDIPTKIAVNEAVEIAKIYDDEKAFSFINGILGTLADNFDD